MDSRDDGQHTINAAHSESRCHSGKFMKTGTNDQGTELNKQHIAT